MNKTKTRTLAEETEPPELVLFFKGESPSLQAASFKMPELERRVEVRNRKPSSRNRNPGLQTESRRPSTRLPIPAFQWTKGVKAVCLYMIGYAHHCACNNPPETYEFSGERGSPACSLDEALGKDNRIAWMMDMFEVRPGEKGEHTNLYALIIRDNPDKKRKNSPFLLSPDLTRYPPLQVQITLNDEVLSSAQSLRSLWRELFRQWGGKPNIKPPPAEFADVEQRDKLPSTTNGAPPRNSSEARTFPAQSPRPPAEPSTLPTPPAPPPEAWLSTRSGQPAKLSPSSIQATLPANPPSTVLVTKGAGDLPSERAVAPFTPVTPSSASFVTQKEPPYPNSGPAYKTIHYEQMPHLSPFKTVRQILGRDRCALIRGTRGSGRTTLAQQLAVDFVRNFGPAYYLDLRASQSSSSFLSDLLNTTFLLSKEPCLIAIDSAEANPAVVAQAYDVWRKANSSSSLLLTDAWAPLSGKQADSLLPIPERQITDLQFTSYDYASLYQFWQPIYGGGGGGRSDVFRTLFPGWSLRRVVDYFNVLAKAKRLRYDPLDAYDVSDIGSWDQVTTELPSIKRYLLQHPEERPCAAPFKILNIRMLQGTLSNHSAIIVAYSKLAEHPILKWFYFLQPLKEVFEFLCRAQKDWPLVFDAFCQELEHDETFCFKMASRVTTLRGNAACGWIVFSDRFLPRCFKERLIEVLYNAGTGFIRKTAGGWDAESTRHFLWFTHDHLPPPFWTSLAEGYREKRELRRLHWLIASLAATDGGAFAKLADDQMILRLVTRKVLQEIAKDPQAFTDRLKPPSANVLHSPDRLVAAAPSPPADNGDGIGSIERNATPGISPAAISVLSSTTLFRNPEESIRFTLKPTQDEVKQLSVPRLSSFYAVIELLERKDRFAIIRGPSRSGRTILAVQAALDYAEKGYAPFYMDLASPGTPEATRLLADAITSSATHSRIFVIDNAHSDKVAAESLLNAWRSVSGPSRLILSCLWAPPDLKDIGIRTSAEGPLPLLDIHATYQDFEIAYNFWRPRLTKHANEPPHCNQKAYLFFGASLRRLQDVLVERGEDIHQSKLLSVYEGQGVDAKFDKRFWNAHRKQWPRLAEDVERNPGDQRFFDWNSRRLMSRLANENCRFRDLLLKGFSDLRGHPGAKWRLLLTPYADLIEFLRRCRKVQPSVFEGFRAGVEQDREFSERMALRALSADAGTSLEYVTLATAFLPKAHVADLAECFRSMGPRWVSNRVNRAMNLRQYSYVLSFLKEWLPETYCS